MAAFGRKERANVGVWLAGVGGARYLPSLQAGEQGGQFGNAAGAQRVTKGGLQRQGRWWRIAENQTQGTGLGQVGAWRTGGLQLEQFDLGGAQAGGSDGVGHDARDGATCWIEAGGRIAVEAGAHGGDTPWARAGREAHRSQRFAEHQAVTVGSAGAAGGAGEQFHGGKAGDGAGIGQ